MTRVLLTAFEPYDRWQANASWLALVELTRELPPQLRLTTRLYPVDFAAVRRKLAEDLDSNPDFALHLGQAPGASAIRLEAIGLNVGGALQQTPEQFRPLVEEGPVAYRTSLPLADWAVKLRSAGIPANVSYHAGEYLCNATHYLSHYLIEQQRLRTQAAFLHVPLDVSQVLGERQEWPTLPVTMTAAGIRIILDQLAALRPADRLV